MSLLCILPPPNEGLPAEKEIRHLSRDIDMLWYYLEPHAAKAGTCCEAKRAAKGSRVPIG